MTAFTGIHVATATPFREDLSLDLDRLAEHCRWLADTGCNGVVVNGSLGEYQALDTDERAAVVRTAVDAAPADMAVIVGTGAPSGHEARRWAEQAAEAGADGLMSLPPTGYRVDRREVLAHYEQVAAAGLPVIVYNNPFDTKIDLTPDLLADIAAIDGVVGVKEFSGDARRVLEILDTAPGLQVICGCDDVLLESLLMGATGWIAGFPNALPEASVRLYELGAAGKIEDAIALYRELLPAFRWDARPQFVQAIKLAMDIVGRYGGPTRSPRMPLDAEAEADVRSAVERALAAV
jgi:1-pyrroline-4-hydroxy-2-carboxylate deaminase